MLGMVHPVHYGMDWQNRFKLLFIEVDVVWML